jgi:hypothetical protein
MPPTPDREDANVSLSFSGAAMSDFIYQHADGLAEEAEILRARVEALEAALEAVQSEILLTGHLAELVNAALAPPEPDK